MPQFTGSAADLATIPAEALSALGYTPDRLADLGVESASSPASDAASSPPPTEATPTPVPADRPAVESPPSAESSRDPSASSDSPTSEPSAAPPGEAADWWKALEGLSDDDLARHPKLQGKIGQIADRLEKRRASEREAKARAEQEQQDLARRNAELADLRYRDPAAYVAREDQLRAEAQRVAKLYDDVYEPAKQVFYDLPDDVQKALSGKTYQGTPGEQVRAYLREGIDLSVKTAVAVERAKWESDVRKEIEARVRKELLPAVRKDVLAELNGGEPSPDRTPSGGPAPALPTDPRAIRDMSLADYERNRERYLGMVSGRR